MLEFLTGGVVGLIIGMIAGVAVTALAVSAGRGAK